ncbi:MAG TPA: rhomboid family intramembrane serine protease [Vicinamibacterales bacterium]|nr:rhomboid family intramembrane serine protease [Vicinamibacterales bacterium]
MSRYGRAAATTYSFGPGPMTPAVKAIIWTNIALFIVTQFTEEIVLYLGLIPQNVVERGWIWQPATYMFLHAGPGHILFNMLGVWMFGVELERMWGTKFFARFYGITGLGAGVTAVAASFLPVDALQATYTAVTIGASGALYGLLMAFALHFPDRPILMFLLFPIPAKYFVMILGALAFLLAPGSQVSNAAHLGGLVWAYLYLNSRRGGGGGLTAELKYRYLKWKMNRLRRKFDVYSGGRSDRIH